MLDKIVVVSKYEAWLIFTDREPIILRSDTDVYHMIAIVLDEPIDNQDEVTQVIEMPVAA